MRMRLWMLGGVLAATTACGQAVAEPPPGGGSAVSADTVVLRMEYVGGGPEPRMLPPGYLTSYPVVTIYGDGRVLSQGGVIAVYPGPALPNVQQGRISAARIAELRQAALDAGVAETGDLGRLPVADASSTRFGVLTDGGWVQREAYALNTGGSDLGTLSAGQRAAREQLSAFQDELSSLPSSGPSEPYDPERLAAVVAAHEAPIAAVPDPDTARWPGPTLPGDPIAGAAGCLVVGGAEMTRVLEAARKATAITAWASAGKTWEVRFRPLLPHERSCADLLPESTPPS